MATARLWLVSTQTPFTSDLVSALRGHYAGFLIPTFSWFILALSLTMPFARRGDVSASDWREWSGRAFAALAVAVMLGFKALTIFGYYQNQFSGGGLIVPGG